MLLLFLSSSTSLVAARDLPCDGGSGEDLVGRLSSPCDIELAAAPSNSMAKVCVSSLNTTSLAAHGRGRPVRLEIFYGAALLQTGLGIVQNGLGIAVAQIKSLHAAGLLCSGGACDNRVHAFLSHVPHSPLLKASSTNGTRPVVMKNAPTAKEALRQLRTLLDALSGGSATLNVSYHNEWEYPALRALWEMASSLTRLDKRKGEGEVLFCYFHNKGASHLPDAQAATLNAAFRKNGNGHGIGRRTLPELALFREVVAPWQAIVTLFSVLGSRVQHLGIAPSLRGFEWFNFWWARPQYIVSRKPPIKPIGDFPDRHYYEGWLAESLRGREDKNNAVLSSSSSSSLGRVGGGCGVSYSLATCQIGSCGQAKWAESKLRSARKKLFLEFTRREGA